MWVDHKPIDVEIHDNNIGIFNVFKLGFHIYGLIIDPNNDLLSVGLIAQLVEHCTGIAGVRVPTSSNSFIPICISNTLIIPVLSS